MFSSPACSAGSVRAQQGQHLPIPHHQYFQGDDGLQRLPHSCWLSQLHASLQDPGLFQNVRTALQTDAAHSLPGNTQIAQWGRDLTTALTYPYPPHTPPVFGEECEADTRLFTQWKLGSGDWENRRRGGEACLRCGDLLLGPLQLP